MRISDWSSDVCSSDLTMKRRISNERCVELESPVDAQFYEDMASQCGPALTKTRSKITVGSHVWEIDVFDTPELWGTEIAEIELSSEGEEFAIPSWLGTEITGDRDRKSTSLNSSH